MIKKQLSKADLELISRRNVIDGEAISLVTLFGLHKEVSSGTEEKVIELQKKLI